MHWPDLVSDWVSSAGANRTMRYNEHIFYWNIHQQRFGSVQTLKHISSIIQHENVYIFFAYAQPRMPWINSTWNHLNSLTLNISYVNFILLHWEILVFFHKMLFPSQFFFIIYRNIALAANEQIILEGDSIQPRKACLFAIRMAKLEFVTNALRNSISFAMFYLTNWNAISLSTTQLKVN